MSETNQIKIRAKKISDINNIDDNFSINQFGRFAYLLLSYKDNNNLPQNFKMSLEQLATAILNKNGAISENEVNFIKYLMNSGNFNYQEDVNITTSTPYIFTYALESDFTKEENTDNLLINNTITQLSYTQSTIGVVPISAGSNYKGFYLKDYTYNANEDSNFGFVWDNHVINGKVWIVVPENFFDMTSRSFLDNNSHKYKICDALLKEPIEPVKIKRTTYNGVSYVLFCYSENGATGKVYFKKIS